MSITVYQRSGHTMGDTLTAMCLFHSLREPVHVYTSAESWYSRWKSILDISDQITITEIHARSPELDTDFWLEGFKVYSPYIDIDHVRLFDQNFEVGRQGKPCAAILINNGDDVKDEYFWNTVAGTVKPGAPVEYPYNKFYSESVYNHANKLIMAAGYDPLVIDSKAISIEQKVYLLNELCEFAISYEGGMTHLAHVLKIPVIVLPWRGADQYSPETTGVGPIGESWLHLDRRSYFLNSYQELLTWNKQRLIDMVEQLHNLQGNNYWLRHPSFPSDEPLLDFLKGSGEKFFQQVAWSKQHVDCPILGGQLF